MIILFKENLGKSIFCQKTYFPLLDIQWFAPKIVLCPTPTWTIKWSVNKIRTSHENKLASLLYIWFMFATSHENTLIFHLYIWFMFTQKENILHVIS